MNLVSLVALSIFPLTDAQPTTVSHGVYRGWQSVRISNGTHDLVVVPKIGRIQFYGLKGGRNLLWENPDLDGTKPEPPANDWRNYGGDKLWFAPQSVWNWPPDPETDGSAWLVSPLNGGIRMASQTSTRLRVRFEREIRMEKSGDVTIRNSMVNMDSKPVRASVWQIAQLNDPTYVTMTAKPTRTMPKGWFGYEEATLDGELQRYDRQTRSLFLKRDPQKSRKYGAGSVGGFMEAVWEGQAFRMDAPYDPRAEYPDNGSAMQVFLNQDPMPYVELELTSPLRQIKPGESVELSVRWQLRGTPSLRRMKQ